MNNLSQAARWLVVVGSTIALIVGNGPILLFTFGVFLKPIAEETGWSRGTMSLGVAAALTVAGLATPMVGRLIDRWGVKRVTLAAITLFAAGFAGISFTPASVGAFIALYALAGLLSSGQAPLPYAKAISSCFEARRGLALGIAMAGVGVGTALMPQIAGALVKAFGWREAYVALGALTWLIAFPAVLLFVKEAPSNDASAPMSALVGEDASAVLRSKNFWAIATAVVLVVTSINGVIAHFVALLTDRGMPTGTAASMIVAVGLATILGRLISGYLLDRVFGPHLAAAIFLVPLIGMAAVWFGGASPAMGIVAAVCFGFGLGAEVDIIGYLVGRYFGLRRYGEIYGYIFALFTIGSGVGPYLMGLSYDATHSYGAALAVFSIMLLASSVIIASLGPYVFNSQKAVTA